MCAAACLSASWQKRSQKALDTVTVVETCLEQASCMKFSLRSGAAAWPESEPGQPEYPSARTPHRQTPRDGGRILAAQSLCMTGCAPPNRNRRALARAATVAKEVKLAGFMRPSSGLQHPYVQPFLRVWRDAWRQGLRAHGNNSYSVQG